MDRANSKQQKDKSSLLLLQTLRSFHFTPLILPPLPRRQQQQLAQHPVSVTPRPSHAKLILEEEADVHVVQGWKKEPR